MDLYWAGSDWLTLTAAAELCTEVLGSKKTEDDVIKAGYVFYHGINDPLRICTFTRKPIEVRPVKRIDVVSILLEGLSEPVPLTDKENELAYRLLKAGEVFELYAPILEKLLFLRSWPTGEGISAVIRADSMEELPLWGRQPAASGGVWTAAFLGVVTPEIELYRDDLRVDRRELLGFLEEAKQARALEVSRSPERTDRLSEAPEENDGPAAGGQSKWWHEYKPLEMAERIAARKRKEQDFVKSGKVPGTISEHSIFEEIAATVVDLEKRGNRRTITYKTVRTYLKKHGFDPNR